MSSNIRPESMARITNFELANAFIEEQVKLVREQVGDKRFCWLCPAVLTLPSLPLC